MNGKKAKKLRKQETIGKMLEDALKAKGVNVDPGAVNITLNNLKPKPKSER